MRIGAVNQDQKSSPWEAYENYRRSLSVGQGKADPSIAAGNTQESALTKSVQDKGSCETCENRRYQDGSNDPGVSFQTPTRLAPEQAASAIRGHEMEHVNRNQSQAKAENKEVVSQSVTYHNAICPECGTVYMSGGTTRTTTRQQPDAAAQAQEGESQGFQIRV